MKNRKKTFPPETVLKEVKDIQNKTFDEIIDNSDDSQGEAKISITLSNVIGIYTRVEILLGLNLSGHTDILTVSSNLIDKLYKKREFQNQQQYRNTLDKFNTQ